MAFPVFVLANLGLGVTSVLPNWNLRRHDARRCRRDRTPRRRASRDARAGPAFDLRDARARRRRSRLDAIFTGGGPVFPDLLERLTAAAAAAPTSSRSTARPRPSRSRISTCATSAPTTGARCAAAADCSPDRRSPDIRLQILDDEIVVTGDHVNKGYLDPRATTAAPSSRSTARSGTAPAMPAGSMRADGCGCSAASTGAPAVCPRSASKPRRASGRTSRRRRWSRSTASRSSRSRAMPASRDLWQRQADRLGALRVVAGQIDAARPAPPIEDRLCACVSCCAAADAAIVGPGSFRERCQCGLCLQAQLRCS